MTLVVPSFRKALVWLLTIVLVATGVLRAVPHDDFGQVAHVHLDDHPSDNVTHDHAGEHASRHSGHLHAGVDQHAPKGDPHNPIAPPLTHHAEHSSMSPHTFLTASTPAIAKPDIATGEYAEAARVLKAVALAPPTPPPNA